MEAIETRPFVADTQPYISTYQLQNESPFKGSFKTLREIPLPQTVDHQKQQILQKTDQYQSPEIKTYEEYEEIRQHLQKIHSVENEAELLKKIEHLSEAEKQLYIKDQVLNMTTEHAMAIPFNTLHIIAKPDGTFCMYGIDILDMYKRTARLPSAGEREKAELKGMQQAQTQLLQGSPTVVEVSPAYCANRGFVFLFATDEYKPELGGTVIKEHILRYDDSPGDLTKSIYIQQELQKLAGYMPTNSHEITDRNQLLTNPVALNSSLVNQLAPVLNILGISQEDIAYSDIAKNLLEQQSENLISRYYHKIVELSQLLDHKDDPAYIERYKDAKNKAELLLEAVYILGDEIKNELKTQQYRVASSKSPKQSTHYTSTVDETLFYQQLALSNQQNSDRLKIQGGSDCGVVSNVLDQLLNNELPVEHGFHLSSSETKDPKCVSCGICGRIGVEIKQGRYYCPDCDELGPKAT